MIPYNPKSGVGSCDMHIRNAHRYCSILVQVLMLQHGLLTSSFGELKRCYLVFMQLVTPFNPRQ